MSTRQVFGTCSWILGMEDVADITATVKHLGLDGFQFHGDHRSHDPIELRQCAQAHGLTLFAIDPSRCAPQDGEQASPAAGQTYYRGVIDFAKACGCGHVTVHGLGFWCAGDPSRSDALEHLVSALSSLCDYAAGKGVELHWEPCNRYEIPMVRTCTQARELLAKVAQPNLHLILDSFHMNIEEHDAIKQIAQSVQYTSIYHISDSNRGGIGSGHIDFRGHHRALSEGGFHGPVMLEIVLPWLAPKTAPASDTEWRSLEAECARSIDAWNSYAAA